MFLAATSGWLRCLSLHYMPAPPIQHRKNYVPLHKKKNCCMRGEINDMNPAPFQPIFSTAHTTHRAIRFFSMGFFLLGFKGYVCLYVVAIAIASIVLFLGMWRSHLVNSLALIACPNLSSDTHTRFSKSGRRMVYNKWLSSNLWQHWRPCSPFASANLRIIDIACLAKVEIWDWSALSELIAERF